MKLLIKIVMVGAMTFAILLSLVMVFGVIEERQRYRREAVADIARSVGQSQVVAGPVLLVPFVETTVREVQGEDGIPRTRTERRNGHWRFFPQQLESRGRLLPDVRRRGLHEVRVFEWQGVLDAAFDVLIPADVAGVTRTLGQPVLSWGISDVRGLRGTPEVEVDGRPLRALQGSRSEIAQGGAAEAAVAGSGLHVPVSGLAPGVRRTMQARLSLSLSGTERFGILPVGDRNLLALESPWPHPSFGGLLPRHRTGQDGFKAEWRIDALATNAQQAWGRVAGKEDEQDVARVALLDPVNPYLQAERATKYGVLFVVLTFGAFLMFELLKQVRVHPVQYGLVGLALSIFFLLLLSLSERLAFGWSYLVAATACIGLIGAYLGPVLGSRLRGAGFAAMLAALYAALYGLLLLEDNALLVGSGLLFAILAAVMLATRKVDWYALSGRD